MRRRVGMRVAIRDEASVPRYRAEPTFTLPGALQIQYRTGSWAADITVDVSHIPEQNRALVYYVAHGMLHRSAEVVDGFMETSEKPVASPRSLLTVGLLVLVAVAAMVC